MLRSPMRSPVNVVLVSAASCPAQPWRNGGGLTRTLLVWPGEDGWRLRISRADVTTDGPFSSYPGVTRWFAVLRGAGVALTMEGVRRELRPDSEALCFDGAAAPDCVLLDGATQDLNLMTRGASACMTSASADQPWQEPWQMRGLYTGAAGNWSDGSRECPLPADTLLWQAQVDPRARWRFTPDAGDSGSAWWLGFTP